MAEHTNKDRAKWAMAMLQCFADITGLDTEDDLETVVGDMLADAMHLCDERGIDFDERLQNAKMHHDAEVQEEKEDQLLS